MHNWNSEGPEFFIEAFTCVFEINQLISLSRFLYKYFFRYSVDKHQQKNNWHNVPLCWRDMEKQTEGVAFVKVKTQYSQPA